jgi:hypothetical protein
MDSFGAAVVVVFLEHAIKAKFSIQLRFYVKRIVYQDLQQHLLQEIPALENLMA